tara:strand:- start:1189 stop:1710 length:522 start_codon:yes stop_codon:yes gene_type:complete
MKKIFFLLIVLFFNNINISNSEEKIVFIDLNFIFSNSVAGKDLNQQIKKSSESLNEKIKNFQKNIDLKKKELLAQKNVINPEDYKSKLFNFENDIKEINQKISLENKNLKIFKSKVEKEFFKKLNVVIEEYSVDNSISIILKKNDLLMAKKELDITTDIINLFNEKVDKISIN